MLDYNGLLLLLIVVYAAVPFLMLFVELAIIHRGQGLVAVVFCPCFWVFTMASVLALAIVLALYPGPEAIASVFIFGLAIPVVIALGQS